MYNYDIEEAEVYSVFEILSCWRVRVPWPWRLVRAPEVASQPERDPSALNYFPLDFSKVSP